jgi:hypothetical protein
MLLIYWEEAYIHTYIYTVKKSTESLGSATYEIRPAVNAEKT